MNSELPYVGIPTTEDFRFGGRPLEMQQIIDHVTRRVRETFSGIHPGVIDPKIIRHYVETKLEQ